MSEITLAIPSKGRLEQATRDAFAEAGLTVTRPGGARAYQGALEGMSGVVVRFVSAGEIARELVRGGVAIGVTGADLIHETAVSGPQSVVFAKQLGFGAADVIIAVPDAWADVTHMRDLSDVAADFRVRHGRFLRIATKYVNLTRRFFADAGIREYRIVESLGATEAAPASGAADLIVDITSTGATLRANGLRILADGVILASQANLIVSRTAPWSTQDLDVVARLLSAFGTKLPENFGDQL